MPFLWQMIGISPKNFESCSHSQHGHDGDDDRVHSFRFGTYNKNLIKETPLKEENGVSLISPPSGNTALVPAAYTSIVSESDSSTLSLGSLKGSAPMWETKIIKLTTRTPYVRCATSVYRETYTTSVNTRRANTYMCFHREKYKKRKIQKLR